MDSSSATDPRLKVLDAIWNYQQQQLQQQHDQGKRNND
jgi:hypothetical protein